MQKLVLVTIGSLLFLFPLVGFSKITPDQALEAEVRFNMRITNLNQKYADEVISWLDRVDGILSKAESWVSFFRQISLGGQTAIQILGGIGIEVSGNITISSSQLDSLLSKIQQARSRVTEARIEAFNLRNKDYSISVVASSPADLERALRDAMEATVREFIRDHNNLRARLFGIFSSIKEIIDEIINLKNAVGL